MGPEHETFWTLLQNAAHWEFELFLMLIFDVVLGLLIWPFVKEHWKHHVLSDEMHGFAEEHTQEKKMPKPTLQECLMPMIEEQLREAELRGATKMYNLVLKEQLVDTVKFQRRYKPEDALTTKD